jgi:hypothetical protein
MFRPIYGGLSVPYEIQRPTKRLRSWALAGAAALGCLGAAALNAAPALADGTPAVSSDAFTASCTDPLLTQPFASLGDANYYTLAPGESDDSFDGTGWRLFGGANIQSQTLADGSAGNVLDLPRGSVAISPLMCVNTSYVSARAMISDVGGDGSLKYFVSYPGTGGSADFGSVTGGSPGGGWSPSDPWQLNPPGDGGWVLARFHFIAPVSDQGDEVQLYDLYVDPYSRGGSPLS